MYLNNLISIALLLAALCLLSFTVYKLQKIHRTCSKIVDQLGYLSNRHLVNLHQQIQALQCLSDELELDRALPPTRGFAASPDFLLLIARHARETRPRVTVECSSGTSTVVLARCMQLNGEGHVYALENDAEFAAQTRANLARYGLTEWATVIDAPLRNQEINGETWNWYDRTAIPDIDIDLLVIDGPPLPLGGPLVRYPAGPVLFPRLAAGATVFLDDFSREGEKQAVKRWQSEFPATERHEHFCEKGCVSITWPNTNGS